MPGRPLPVTIHYTTRALHEPSFYTEVDRPFAIDDLTPGPQIGGPSDSIGGHPAKQPAFERSVLRSFYDHGNYTESMDAALRVFPLFSAVPSRATEDLIDYRVLAIKAKETISDLVIHNWAGCPGFLEAGWDISYALLPIDDAGMSYRPATAYEDPTQGIVPWVTHADVPIRTSVQAGEWLMIGVRRTISAGHAAKFSEYRHGMTLVGHTEGDDDPIFPTVCLSSFSVQAGVHIKSIEVEPYVQAIYAGQGTNLVVRTAANDTEEPADPVGDVVSVYVRHKNNMLRTEHTSLCKAERQSPGVYRAFWRPLSAGWYQVMANIGESSMTIEFDVRA